MNMSRKEVVVSNVSKSIMGIMAFNPSKGMTVNIVAEGSDEEEALDAMEKFLVCE